MTLPNWGSMQKSLDDPRTIAEFIADTIAEHNDNPESHLGEGQSLSEHKHEGVIDHPEGSILADKMTTTELLGWHDFSALSRWTVSANIPTVGAFGVIFPIDSYATNEHVWQWSPIAPGLDYTRDLVMQHSVQVQYYAQTYKFNIMYGRLLSGSQTNGFGWDFENLNVKGYFFTSTGRVETSNYTFTENEQLILRIHFDPTNDTCYFFVNGDLLGSIASPAKPTSTNIQISIRHISEYVAPDSYDLTELRLLGFMLSRGKPI